MQEDARRRSGIGSRPGRRRSSSPATSRAAARQPRARRARRSRAPRPPRPGLRHRDARALRGGRPGARPHAVRPMVAWPYDGAPRGDGDPASSSRARTATPSALGDVQRRLDLPVAEPDSRPAGRRGRGAPRGYTLRSWAGRSPTSCSRAGPADLGADDRGADRRHRPRARGRRPRPRPRGRGAASKQGRELYNTVALDADGDGRRLHRPRCQHRAHRAPTSGAPWCAPSTAATGWGWRSRSPTCGCSSAAGPTLGQVVTWNAEVNAHMIGVNEAMGFVPVERPASSRRSSRSAPRRAALRRSRRSRTLAGRLVGVERQLGGLLLAVADR